MPASKARLESGWRLEAGGWTAWTAMTPRSRKIAVKTAPTSAAPNPWERSRPRRRRHRSKRSRSRPLLQEPRRTRGSDLDREGGDTAVKDRGQDAPTRATPTRGSGLDREGGDTAVKDRGQDRSYMGHAEPVGAVSTAKGAHRSKRSRSRPLLQEPRRTRGSGLDREKWRHRSKRSRSRPLLQGPRRTRGSGLDREGGDTAVKDRGQDRSYMGHAEPVGAVSTAKGAAPE